MRIAIEHQITEKDLLDISQNRLIISDKIINQLAFSQQEDCLLKILVPDVLFEIYSVIKSNYLKISKIERNFFQSFSEGELIYMELVANFTFGVPHYRLNCSKRCNFADLIIEIPPQVSSEVISYIKKAI